MIPPAKGRGKDRWGLRPVRAGTLRGQVRNIRRSNVVGDFGDMTVIDFDLFIDDGQKPVPVQMSGTDFFNEVVEGPVVDVRDPDPAVRPILATRLDFPPQYNHEVISCYPGRDDAPAARERIGGVLMVIGPIVFAAALIALFYVFYE